MFKKIFEIFQLDPERSLAVLLGVIILSLGLVFITLAWTEPSSPPPGGNVSAPINVSGTNQTKKGILHLGTNSHDYMKFLYQGDNDWALWKEGTGDSDNQLDVQLHIPDDQDNSERFSIWGGSCSHGGCSNPDNDIVQHYFTAAGNAWHRADLTAGRLCIDGEGCKSSWSDIASVGEDKYLPDNPANSNVDMNGKDIREVNDLYFDNGSRIGDWSNWMRIYSGLNDRIYTPNMVRIQDGLQLDDSGIYDYSDGYLDVRDGIDMHGHHIKNLRNLYGDGSRDIYFYDRPRSEDGLYIQSGTAYFNGEIRVDHIQDRGGGNTIYSDSHWDWNNHDIWDVNQLATDYFYKAGGGNIHMRDNIDFDNRDIYDAHVIKSDYFYYTSDRRLKENIVSLEDSLNKVMNLKGISFDWRKEKGSSIGLIAQDLEKEFPKAVATDEETGMKSINYGVLTAPLIESVKAQQNQIEKLKEENKSQQQQIDQLQQEIEQIKEEIE